MRNVSRIGVRDGVVTPVRKPGAQRRAPDEEPAETSRNSFWAKLRARTRGVTLADAKPAEVLKRYGVTYVVCSIMLSLCSFSLFYALVVRRHRRRRAAREHRRHAARALGARRRRGPGVRHAQDGVAHPLPADRRRLPPSSHGGERAADDGECAERVRGRREREACNILQCDLGISARFDRGGRVRLDLRDRARQIRPNFWRLGCVDFARATLTPPARCRPGPPRWTRGTLTMDASTDADKQAWRTRALAPPPGDDLPSPRSAARSARRPARGRHARRRDARSAGGRLYEVRSESSAARRVYDPRVCSRRRAGAGRRLRARARNAAAARRRRGQRAARRRRRGRAVGRAVYGGVSHRRRRARRARVRWRL